MQSIDTRKLVVSWAARAAWGGLPSWVEKRLLLVFLPLLKSSFLVTQSRLWYPQRHLDRQEVRAIPGVWRTRHVLASPGTAARQLTMYFLSAASESLEYQLHRSLHHLNRRLRHRHLKILPCRLSLRRSHRLNLLFQVNRLMQLSHPSNHHKDHLIQLSHPSSHHKNHQIQLSHRKCLLWHPRRHLDRQEARVTSPFLHGAFRQQFQLWPPRRHPDRSMVSFLAAATESVGYQLRRQLHHLNRRHRHLKILPCRLSLRRSHQEVQ
jgi:hypothetical protein